MRSRLRRVTRQIVSHSRLPTVSEQCQYSHSGSYCETESAKVNELKIYIQLLLYSVRLLVFSVAARSDPIRLKIKFRFFGGAYQNLIKCNLLKGLNCSIASISTLPNTVAPEFISEPILRKKGTKRGW